VGTYARNQELARANLQDVLSNHPDLIYFAGYSGDARTLLKELSTNKQIAPIPVMGGDDLYNLVGDSSQNVLGLDRLIFTAFASPDEWQDIDPSVKKPPFFQEYAQIFASGGLHPDRNTPTGEEMLSYDAMRVLLQAIQTALTNKKAPLTGQDLQQALKNITSSHAFQGVSGQITFGQDGNPQEKTVVMLNVDKQGKTHILGADGKFLLR
jgi:ABC-type branched-subunit amino acid transport system substrate-binding protein